MSLHGDVLTSINELFTGDAKLLQGLYHNYHIRKLGFPKWSVASGLSLYNFLYFLDLSYVPSVTSSLILLAVRD
jgi:hypothetical protein